MPGERLPALKPREVQRALERAGFVVVGQRGSHLIFRHPHTGRRVPLSMHARDLKRGTLLGLLKEAGLTQKDFLRFL